MTTALERSTSVAAAWRDALTAIACVVVDPMLGGIRVRAAAGPVRDAWISLLRASIPVGAPIRPVPLHVDDGRLFGGLDLAASLARGRPIVQPGLLAQVDGGYALLSMAERIDPAVATRIALAIDGDAQGSTSRFAAIAFDEGDDEEAIGATLQERLGVAIDLRACSVGSTTDATSATRESLLAARSRLQRVEVPDVIVEALCAAALALGIESLRMPFFAVRVARVLAALDGRDEAEADDAATAARLVFTMRARRLPTAAPPEQVEGDADEADPLPEASSDDAPPDEAPQPDQPEAPPPADEPPSADPADESDEAVPSQNALDEVVLEAVLAAMPPDLLRELARGAASHRSQGGRGSGAGAVQHGGTRGAPSGVRRGKPRARERLSLIETLRAAAPWQRIRREERPLGERGTRIHVRVDDLHVVRYRQRHPTTTVFVVDASGSSALNRLAEAKGAVELLLADCYVRRDSVAVLAFRGKSAQLLLPPTRSLVRARRSLAGLPGGGGTPVASALDATRELVVALRRRGDTVLVVLLTDGRANVARDGSGGRPQADADAMESARSLRALAVDLLLIDTSPKPYPQAAALAEAMGALYRPLPSAGAREMSGIVNRAARGQAGLRAA